MSHKLKPVVALNVGSPMKQFRFARMRLGSEIAFLTVHSNCAEDDPWAGMFFLPTDTLKVTAFDIRGQRLWHRDLGGGMIPGIWFCPVMAFDLDGDGDDEVWLVSNSDPDHPLDHRKFQLDRMSGRTGKILQSMPWPAIDGNQSTSHAYRNFIQGGFSHGQRRLLTAQGTYGEMRLQCWDPQLRPVWTRIIAKDEPGARGSHMFPVLDIDGDGRDELLWGERCIDIDTGQDIWVADKQGWPGHTDIIQPTLDCASGRWRIYTCRENWPGIQGGVVTYDDCGRELWGIRDMGHMDMGWTARLADDGSHLCYALLIGEKSAGPEGFKRGNVTEYLFDLDGKQLPVEFPLYNSLPVDFDGDGLHELMYMGGERANLVVDRKGTALYDLEGAALFGCKVLDAPGEQIVTWDADGMVRIYACPDAKDSSAAMQRYSHPYYDNACRSAACGYNRTNLGGI
jgi:hypothetical protein